MNDAMENKRIHTILNTTYNLKYRLIFDGIFVGILSSIVCIAYRFLLKNAEAIIFAIAAFVKTNPLFIIALFLFLMILAFLISNAIRYEPYIAGSGIPQIEAEIINQIDETWWRVILLKIAAGTLCILGGLSLGREGPSIQLGGMCGKGFAKHMKRIRVEQRYLITCGASAGLAAAFNAPLAGIMFALEELHKNFSTSVLVSVTTSAIIADFISQAVFGLQPAINISLASSLPLHYYLLVIILGVVCGVCACIYNKLILKTQDIYKKIPFLKKHHFIYIAMLFSFFAILFLPEIMGGGHHLIALLSDHLSLSMLLILLIAKFLFSIISFGSGAPGGIFFPILVLGSFVGAIFANVNTMMFGMDSMYAANFIILAMAGLLTGIVRAPITGIVLIAEMTGSLRHLSALALVSICAYVVAHYLKSKPIYESLLSRLLANEQKPMEHGEANKRIIEIVIEVGSQLEQKQIQQIDWPLGCLIVGLRHGSTEVLPNGSSTLYAGCTLVVLMDEENAIQNEAMLQAYAKAK